MNYLYKKKTKRRVLVAGDIHGDSRIKRLTDFFKPGEDFLIFLGDYADRGDHGVEVINFVNDLIKEYDSVIGLRGNHEIYSKRGEPGFQPCSLKKEVTDWNGYFQNELEPFLNNLYLSAVINNTLFVHGGVSSRVTSEEVLRNPSEEVVNDLLWSDPVDGMGERKNPRGKGVLFGEDVSKEVCERLGVKRIVRSHEPRKASHGVFYEHDGRVVTTSSTSVYGGKPFVLDLSNLREYFL